MIKRDILNKEINVGARVLCVIKEDSKAYMVPGTVLEITKEGLVTVECAQYSRDYLHNLNEYHLGNRFKEKRNFRKTESYLLVYDWTNDIEIIYD